MSWVAGSGAAAMSSAARASTGSLSLICLLSPIRAAQRGQYRKARRQWPGPEQFSLRTQMGTFSLSMAVANNCGKLTAECRSTATFRSFPPLPHVSHLPWSLSFGTKRPWVQIAPPRLLSAGRDFFSCRFAAPSWPCPLTPGLAPTCHRGVQSRHGAVTDGPYGETFAPPRNSSPHAVDKTVAARAA